eukprot:2475581-Prymnesium_polylepis.1
MQRAPPPRSRQAAKPRARVAAQLLAPRDEKCRGSATARPFGDKARRCATPSYIPDRAGRAVPPSPADFWARTSRSGSWQWLVHGIPTHLTPARTPERDPTGRDAAPLSCAFNLGIESFAKASMSEPRVDVTDARDFVLRHRVFLELASSTSAWA